MLKMSRSWAMPSKSTFSIKPIRELIDRYMSDGLWVDPFVGESPFKPSVLSNDLNPGIDSDYTLECVDFLDTLEDQSCDGVLFDPPYSPRQISECYEGIGRRVHQKDTQSSFYGNRKRLIASKLKMDGIAICAAWNSGGLGKCNGMELIEVLLVPHGGAHNDTIITVERKVKHQPSK